MISWPYGIGGHVSMIFDKEALVQEIYTSAQNNYRLPVASKLMEYWAAGSWAFLLPYYRFYWEQHIERYPLFAIENQEAFHMIRVTPALDKAFRKGLMTLCAGRAAALRSSKSWLVEYAEDYPELAGVFRACPGLWRVIFGDDSKSQCLVEKALLK